MNNRAQSMGVGLFFLLGLALFWVVYDTLSEGAFSDQATYEIEAPFPSLKQLKEGDDVRLAGVRIGKVGQTSLVKGKAIAVLEIVDEYEIPNDSTAEIATAGLLGFNYVTIHYGTSGKMFEDGARIATKTSPDIHEVIAELGKIGGRVNQFLGTLEESLGTGEGEGGPTALFKNINELIVENRDKIDTTLSNLQKVSDELATGKGTLGKLIQDDEAYDKVLSTVAEIEEAADDASKLFKDADVFVTDAGTLFDEIRAGKGALGTLIYDESVASNIRESSANIAEFTERLNRTDTTLGRLISDDDLYLRAQSTLNKVGTAVDSINDSGPISAVGIATNALF